MATGGTLIQVSPKTVHDLGYLPPSTTDGPILAKALNLIGYGTATLWVQVFQRRLGSGATISLVATGALPSPDTQQAFLEATSTTLLITGTAPVLLPVALPTQLAPYYQIKLEAFMPAAPTYIGVEIAVFIVARCCG